MEKTPEKSLDADSSKLIRGVSWNALGNVSTLVFTLLLSIYLARVLGSHGYGIWSLLTSLLGVIVVLFNFGFDATLNRYVPELRHRGLETTIRPLIKKMALAKMGAVLVLAPILLVGKDEVSRIIFKDSLVTDTIPLLAIVLYLFVIDGVVRATLASFYQQKFLNLAEVVLRITTIIAVVALLQWKLEVFSVLLGFAIGQAIFLLACLAKIYSILPASVSKEHTLPLRSFALSMYLFAILAYVLGPQLDILMLGLFSIGPEEIALYCIGFYLAYTVLSLFPMLMAGGITLTFVSELHTKDKKKQLRQTHSMMLEYMFFFNIPITIGGIIVGSEIIGLLYPPEFGGAYLIFSIYLVFLTFLKLGGITSTFLAAMNHQTNLLKARTLGGCLNIFLNIVLIPKWGLLGAVVATGSSGIIALVWEFLMVHRLIKPKYPLVFLLKTGIAGSIMGIMVWVLATFLNVAVIISVPCAGLFYFALQFFMHPFSQETKQLLSQAGSPFSKFFHNSKTQP